jgi:hypothetical protein
LPGEREELHARLAAELARAPQPMAAELAQHWAAAGRAPEALVASVVAGREAEAVFGLAEAVQHLERALEFWDLVPEAAELVGLDLAALRVWAAEVASEMGAGPRAVELVRRAIALVDDPVRARCSTRASAASLSHPAATRPRSPRSGLRSAWSPPSRSPPSASTCWRRSAMG